MHGASVTVQVTSPTRRLLSLIVRVVDIGPLISSASAVLADTRSATPTKKTRLHVRVPRMKHPFQNWLTNEITDGAGRLLYTVFDSSASHFSHRGRSNEPGPPRAWSPGVLTLGPRAVRPLVGDAISSPGSLFSWRRGDAC